MNSIFTVLFLLIMRARARPLFLRKVFQILSRISQSNGKDRYLSVEIRFRISRSMANLKSGFSNPNLDFLIERTLKLACKNSGLFSPLGIFRKRNIPSREEKGETAVFAGYIKMCGSRTYIHTHSMHGYSKFPGD